MNKIIGMLAHVDAGKTTLCEQLLFRAGTLRKAGRVDNGSSFLDTDEIERRRGITVFSGQAQFDYNGNNYYLLDTPGHIDFSVHMELALSVLDYAVLIISAPEGIQAHTETVWSLLETYHIPAFIFLNKTDRDGGSTASLMLDIERQLSPDALLMEGGIEEYEEFLAQRDEIAMEQYLSGRLDAQTQLNAAKRLLHNRQFSPVFSGSALLGDGIERFLSFLDKLTETEYEETSPFGGRVYKILHSAKGVRQTFIKITSGTLRVKDSINGEKINELYRVNGGKLTAILCAEAGSLCMALGLTCAAGAALGDCRNSRTLLTAPAITARVEYDKAVPAATVVSNLKILADEDPSIQVSATGEKINVSLMGTVQSEIISERYLKHFGTPISFGKGHIAYKETIAAPTIGYGHYEPLRHYAEVHLKMEPGKRGAGISFESTCSTDILERNWQRLIETHVFEREYAGLLTGSPLTDLKITLLFGRAHLKHTEGGDFRQAVYRAMRQGLEKAQNLLLEPVYAFSARVGTEHLGKLTSDLIRMSAIFDAPVLSGDRANITGRVPVSEMLEYPATLAAYTRGRGYISLRLCGYDECHNTEQVIVDRAYNPLEDCENISDSIFCSHGAGFTVHWNEVENYIIKL